MSGRLILVRHGQTVANALRQLDTLPPGAELSEEGREQAALLGLGLARRPLAALVASTAVRTQQTAQPVSHSTGQDTQILDGLYEIQAGELEGRSDEAAHRRFIEMYRGWHHGDLDTRVPGGESGRDALRRYLPVIDELRQGYLMRGGDDTGDVVVVSHGAIIRLAVAQLAGVDARFADTRHLANTESIELVPTPDGGWECARWGSHYPPFEEPVREITDDPMG